MSIKEQLHQKIEMMSPKKLEWLNAVLKEYERLLQINGFADDDSNLDEGMVEALRVTAVASQEFRRPY